MIFGIICVLLTSIFVLLIIPHIMRLIGELRIKNICKNGRLLVLTYDDGPSQELTPKILRVLEEEQVLATFFMLGGSAVNNIEIINKITKSGHEVGTHSQQHINAWKSNPVSAWRDINNGFLTASALNIHTPLFRPPFGKITVFTLIQILLYNKKFAWWTYDSTDTSIACKKVHQVVDEVRLQQGGVILMHDHYRTNNLSRNDYVVDLTRSLIKMAKEEGIAIKSLTQLMERR